MDTQLLKILAETLDSGLIIYDNNFQILHFNKGAEDMFGVKAQDIIGQNFTLDKAQDSSWKSLSMIIYSSLAPTVVRLSETNDDFQVLKIILDNPRKEYETRTSQVKDEGGQIIAFIKLVKDVTREASLLKSKSDFVTVAAHQLRTPATAINWSFENLMKDQGLNVSSREAVNIGYKTSQGLLKIINDLLNVAQLEEGRFDYQFQNINLIDFLDKLLAEASPIAGEYKVNLYFERPPEKEITVSADSAKLGLAISNLIDNAIKYNVSGGRITVGVSKKNNSVQVSVKDTGIGISEDDLPNLFSKFFRAKNVEKFVVGGSGLGLYLVKNIIEEHGGNVWVESVLDRGSTFYFTLPLEHARTS